ncbi:hypothetical protein [Hymenobacter fodinae]|uniref:Uncharacterized protein n=1 Tax=Hymenobacter fodinae TaxID=2510796 RepID=A0A4Z0P6I4_9BACT|nr:hypothetical protein [Hymenobacter fodinae]TGE08013.1 hypothetical protein EU556_09735 [Hymenobacter fodinae]
MLQPKNLLMKRGALLGKEPRVDQKVFAAIGSPDFAAAISVIFSGYCPATVSASETVFLCPLRSSVTAPQPVQLASGKSYPLPEPWLLPPASRPTTPGCFSVMESDR